MITPSYNHRPYLRARVGSVLGQTCTDFEWIVVDDASTDGSQDEWVKLAGTDPRVRLLFHESNRGLAATTDEAIACSSGSYVVRAESDDFCRPDFLQRLAAELDAHPSVGLVHARTHNLDAGGRAWPEAGARAFPVVLTGEAAFAAFVFGNPVSGPSTMVRRSVLEAVGGFGSPVCAIACDWHLALRVSTCSDIGFVDEAVGYHRLHGANASRDRTAMLWEAYAILASAFAAVPSRWTLPAELPGRAVRAVSHGPGAAVYLGAVARGRLATAAAVRQRIEANDPGATVGPAWWAALSRKVLVGGARAATGDLMAHHLLGRPVPGAAASPGAVARD